jgi:hypothetical protein
MNTRTHRIIVICIVILALLVTCSIASPLINDKAIWSSQYKTIPFVDGEEITFLLDDIANGIYHIGFWYTPINSDIASKLESPLIFECDIEIKQGNNLKTKQFALTVPRGRMGEVRHLFAVPIDVMPTIVHDIEITIKNITFDKNFSQYYKECKFSFGRTSMFFK